MQNLKFLACLHGSKMPLWNLISPPLRGAGRSMIFTRNGHSVVLKNIIACLGYGRPIQIQIHIFLNSLAA